MYFLFYPFVSCRSCEPARWPGSAWPSELGPRYHLSPGSPGPIRQRGATHMTRNIIRVFIMISCSHYIANCSFLLLIDIALTIDYFIPWLPPALLAQGRDWPAVLAWEAGAALPASRRLGPVSQSRSIFHSGAAAVRDPTSRE